ncbi:MAG: patatin family protein [Patescibacteria group bacterium]|nr:patatin family protein [Patescibacteria group bacterium]
MSDPIHQIIKSNLKRKAREKENNDVKTALVIQGGGMRASYSMGSLLSLEEMGFNNSFDYVFGSSAGAINGAYFMAHQSKLATEIYTDYLTNSEFINFFRLKEILDVEYLIKLFTQGNTALDAAAVINSAANLIFSMIHYPSAKEIFFESKKYPKEIMNLIKTSATIPAISNKKILIDGEKYIDGGVVNPTPILEAINLGCTDIVVILTRSRKFRRKPSKFVYNNLSWNYFKDWPKKSKDSLFERFSKVNEIYDFIWSHEGDNGKYRIMIIAPDKDNLAGLLSRNKQKIAENISRGYADALKSFK